MGQVNLAARLMVKAGDGIFCDQSVYDATRSIVSYDPPISIHVKGKVCAVSSHFLCCLLGCVARGHRWIG